jgi:hypothetical protein
MKLKTGRSIGWNLEYATMKITQRIYDGCDCYPWMKVFAWWPVKTIGGKYIWGRKVYKRKFWAVWGTGFHMEPEVEYAELFDILRIEE